MSVLSVLLLAAGIALALFGAFLAVLYGGEALADRDWSPRAGRHRIGSPPVRPLLVPEEGVAYYPTKRRNHIDPACPGLARADHARDLAGQPVPGVGLIDPGDPTVCGTCARRLAIKEYAR